MTVIVFEESADGVFQFAGAAVNPAAQLLFGEQGEPALDQVEPGAAGGSEVQMEARMAQQPALDGRGLVGAVIIEDQVRLQFARDCGVDGFKEAAKLDRAVTAMELADYGAGLVVERGEQVDGAMAHVVRSSARGLPGAHRQQRLTAIERLNLRFLINAQHQCPVRRIKLRKTVSAEPMLQPDFDPAPRTLRVHRCNYVSKCKARRCQERATLVACNSEIVRMPVHIAQRAQ